MNVDILRREVEARGWLIVDERGPDAAPDYLRIRFHESPDAGEAVLFVIRSEWRCIFHGTIDELGEVWDALGECGVRP